ncbi:hypothetical protein CL658_04425 [bacterium]|nr:hypothetical protein [bacterium]|tara:strand:+ start:406 stop:1647 length:1242 start_codon:yes stop_codon:yes gene_type:complete
MRETQVAIIGAGLAGITAARHFEKHHIDYIIIEKKHTLGGKQKTSLINGYQCDHGFQILLTAYPDVIQQLDIKALKPHYFNNGAKLWYQNAFKTISDPFQNVFQLPLLLQNPLLSYKDYWKLFKLNQSLKKQSIADIFATSNQTTENLFKTIGFSKKCQDYFLKPFFRGIFLDHKLTTSSRLCLYYWKCFLEGKTLIPQEGIAAIPKQLESHLNPNKIIRNTTITNIHNSIISTDTHTKIKADFICCATDYEGASALFNLPNKPYQSVSNYYYETDSPPISNSYLHLDGSAESPINNFHNVTAINPHASPPGKHLLSVTSIPNKHPTEHFEKNILKQLKHYFGNQVETWNLVTQIHIPKAITQQPISYAVLNTHYNTQNIYFCGDWTIQGSIQGALYSGKKIANQIINKIHTP